MSIRINFQNNFNKTYKREVNTSLVDEDCTDCLDKDDERINTNTPRLSETKTNDLSKKKILNTSASQGKSRNHPSTTDKLSNCTADSNFVIDQKFSSNEGEREYVIEECSEYMIRTPEKKDSGMLNHDICTTVRIVNNISQSHDQQIYSNSLKFLETKTNTGIDNLKSVVKNLNDDFKKIEIEFNCTKDSKHNLSNLSNIIAEKKNTNQFYEFKKRESININKSNNFLFQMIKMNSKDKERDEINRSNYKLDRGFVYDKVLEDQRISEINEKVKSMIKDQDTQMNTKQSVSCYSLNSACTVVTCFQKFCKSK